jgi:hypothetical protein
MTGADRFQQIGSHTGSRSVRPADRGPETSAGRGATFLSPPSNAWRHSMIAIERTIGAISLTKVSEHWQLSALSFWFDLALFALTATTSKSRRAD